MAGNVKYPLVDPDAVTAAAWAATNRQEADEALRLWQRLRRDFPERPDGYIWPIQVLWRSGRLDEADALAAEALARFPENPDMLAQSAWIAMTRECWDDALHWWSAVRARVPGRTDGFLWAARALWKLSRFDEAEAMAAEALRLFPGNADIEAERGWIAVNRGEWTVAANCWQRVLNIDPGRREARVRLVQAMRFGGRTDEAERTLKTALARHPDDPDLLVEHVWIAADRGDWREAAARLEAARERLLAAGVFDPTDEAIRARMREAAGQPSSGSGSAVPAAGALDNPAATIGDLMLSFESLGERCDFGAVQRHYGAEPESLLRFAFSPLGELIGALGDRFAAVGTAEDTEFETSDQGEAILKSKKYGLMFHTFVMTGKMAVSFRDGELKVWRLNTPAQRDAFREDQRDRLLSLKRRLIDGFKTPQKIFAYSNDERTSEDDAHRLFAALRGYGAGSLLYVRPADAAHPAGTVTRLRDGLYLGHYTGLTDFVAGQQPAFELWRRLLEQTHRLTREGPRRRRRSAV